MSGRRLDVSAIQAVSSMLAAITGAIAASGLGIAGTIAGAAFLSLVSTVGAAVYRLYLARGNDRLRAAAATLAPWTNGNVAAATVVRRHSSPAAAREAGPQAGQRAGPRPGAAGAGSSAPEASTTGLPDWAYAADAAETRVIPALAARPVSTRPGASSDADTAADTAADGSRQVNRQLPPGDRTGTARLVPADGDVSRTGLRDSVPGGTGSGPGGSDPGPDGPDRRRGPAGGRRRWLLAAAAALGVFVVAMGAVTAIEAIAGKPLAAVVWHEKASGTTVGNVVDGPPARPRHSHPAGSPSPTAPASSGSTPTGSVPVTPAPTPTPTGTSSTTPAPSDSPSIPVSPSPTGSPQPGTSVTPQPPAG